MSPIRSAHLIVAEICIAVEEMFATTLTVSILCWFFHCKIVNSNENTFISIQTKTEDKSDVFFELPYLLRDIQVRVAIDALFFIYLFSKRSETQVGKRRFEGDSKPCTGATTPFLTCLTRSL
jgi:hypothetical protein